MPGIFRWFLLCAAVREGGSQIMSAPAEADEERKSRLEYQTAMALMGDEPSAGSPSTVAVAEQDTVEGGEEVSDLKASKQEAYSSSNGDGARGIASETSSNTDKVQLQSVSPDHTAPAVAAPSPVPSSVATLPTKRTVRELLETRNTSSKMEIGQGVLLTADIAGAELVIIRGQFEGKVKAQCIDIEQGAEVRGVIECEAARINGTFDGVFVSVHSLHLASHANVSGRIIYRRLKVAKGAQLYGHSEYRSPVLSTS